MVKRHALTAMLVLLVAALLLAGLSSAEARRGRTRVNLGFGFGTPVFPYYYPPFVVPPPPVIFWPPPPPPVIYTAPPVVQLQPSPQSWYYCDNPQGYYPWVTFCNSGWRRVPATPQQ